MSLYLYFVADLSVELAAFMARSQVFNAANNFQSSHDYACVDEQTELDGSSDKRRQSFDRCLQIIGGTVRTHLREPKISDRGNILMIDKGVGLDLLNEPQGCAQSQLIEAERMSAIGAMACSISHDMRHTLTAIYANAEFLERDDICASARADLLLEIQEAVLAMTERIESLLRFGTSGRKSPLVRAGVSLVVEKAVAAVKFHPDGQNVSITFGECPVGRRSRISPRPRSRPISPRLQGRSRHSEGGHRNSCTYANRL